MVKGYHTWTCLLRLRVKEVNILPLLLEAKFSNRIYLVRFVVTIANGWCVSSTERGEGTTKVTEYSEGWWVFRVAKRSVSTHPRDPSPTFIYPHGRMEVPAGSSPHRRCLHHCRHRRVEEPRQVLGMEERCVIHPRWLGRLGRRGWGRGSPTGI